MQTLEPKLYVAKGNPKHEIVFLRIGVKMHAKTVIPMKKKKQTKNCDSVYQWKTPGKTWQCHIYYHNNTTMSATIIS